MRYEYKVIPAPGRGAKARGVRTVEGRFAHAVEQVMNDMAREGWEYQRAETLPSEERAGLTKTQVVSRSLLVFRRALTTGGLRDPLPEDESEHAGEALPKEPRLTARPQPVSTGGTLFARMGLTAAAPEADDDEDAAEDIKAATVARLPGVRREG